VAPPVRLAIAALLALDLTACVTPAHRYQVTRESQLKAVARDLYDGIARLPHGMVLNELSEPLLTSEMLPDTRARSAPQQRR